MIKIPSKQYTFFSVERIPNINYNMPYLVFDGYGKVLKKLGASDYIKHLVWVFKDGVADLCYEIKEFDQGGDFILNKSINNTDWLKQRNLAVEVSAEKYYRFSKSLLRINLSSLSDRQLAVKLKKLLELQNTSHQVGQPTTWLIDGRQQFSNYLFGYLRKIIKLKKLKLNPASVFSILTSPLKPSFTEIENRESLILAKLIDQDKVAKQLFRTAETKEIIHTLKSQRPALYRKMLKHQQKWFWLHYNYQGPILELDYFLQIWQGLIRESKINRYLLEAETKFKHLEQQQTTILKKLNFDQKHKKIFEQARYVVWLKAFRKDRMYFGSYVANLFTKEIAKRLAISFNQAEYMTPPELMSFFKKKIKAEELNQRYKFSIIYSTWDKVYVYSGKEALNFFNKVNWEKEKTVKVDKLFGLTASPGKAKGAVKIIETIQDISKMKEGDIMLSETTYPALVPAMKKASAIVTNIGGLTCHAAIIARELKIPCIVGTKIATKVFKDGDRVEVDANKGVVKKI